MVEQRRRLLAPRSFEPFTILMSCGDRYFVASRDHVFVHPKGTRLTVAFDDGTTISVSALHFTAFEEGKPLGQSHDPSVVG